MHSNNVSVLVYTQVGTVSCVHEGKKKKMLH
jgi:hypothetical protein